MTINDRLSKRVIACFRQLTPDSSVNRLCFKHEGFDIGGTRRYIYRMRKRLCFVVAAIAYLLIPAAVSSATERLGLTGAVSDEKGKPVEHATVLVYKAGVKKGYNIYCPTCYVDWGKLTITDSKGRLTIQGLS